MASRTALLLTFILFSSRCVTVTADTCTIPPLSLPLKNNTLQDGIALNRGVEALLGGQPQGLRITFTLNNTRLRNANDCNSLGNSTQIAGCLGASGGVYSVGSSFTYTTTSNWSVEHVDPAPKDATILRGYDSAQVGNVTIPQLPIEVWSANATNKSGLALGPDSSVLKAFVDAGKAPSRALGLFFGSRSMNFAQDGELLVGGYDAGRVNGPFTNFSLAPQGLDSFCPLQVRIKDVALNNVNGSFSLIGDTGATTVTACIDPLQSAFTFTQPMWERWANLTQHPANYSDQVYPPEKAPLIGNLTITFSNGYTSTIPSYEMLSLERGTTPQGQYGVISNRAMSAVSKGPTDYGDIPILGGVFLSQNYLTVDYDKGMFQLAPAKVGSQETRSVQTICTTSSVSSASKNVGAIAGGVVGGVAFLVLLGALVGCFCWRRRRGQRRGIEPAPAEFEKDYPILVSPGRTFHEDDK